MKKNKPYKAVDPIVTINNIRNILSKCGIFLIEDQNISTSGFFSTRLLIGNSDLFKLRVGQNGKGLTPEYSLASAYGEFMERLQNYNIFVNGLSYARNENRKSIESELFLEILKKGLALDFVFDPKEKYYSYDELTKRQRDICDNISAYNELVNFQNSKENSGKSLYVPFYCVKEKCTEYLPIRAIYLEAKSNGMCAGNTKEEAILQGLCEIFERYVAKMIYKYEITPPDIPIDLFKGTKIYDLISHWHKENENISIIIKDCSLDKGLPVVGLLIIDHESNSYAFHLGADPSPVVALERCFTELFQCRQLDSSLKKMNICKDPFGELPLQRKQKINEEFFKFVSNGTGLLPNSILLSKSSYQFNGLNLNLSKSDKSDLKYLLEKIDTLGFRTYIRDVSFLNFPSFFIYIPGMSEISSVFSDKDCYNRNNITYQVLYNIKNKTLDEYKQAIEILEKETTTYIRLFPYNIHEDNYVDRNFLLALIYYKLSDFYSSYEKLSVMIDSFAEEEYSQNSYLLCSRDYIYYKSKGFHYKEISDILCNVYMTDVLSEVIEDLEFNDNIFKYQNYPTCFNCSACKMQKDCYYLSVLSLLKTVQKKHKENLIDQNNLSEIFDFSNINE